MLAAMLHEAALTTIYISATIFVVFKFGVRRVAEDICEDGLRKVLESTVEFFVFAKGIFGDGFEEDHLA